MAVCLFMVTCLLAPYDIHVINKFILSMRFCLRFMLLAVKTYGNLHGCSRTEFMIQRLNEETR